MATRKQYPVSKSVMSAAIAKAICGDFGMATDLMRFMRDFDGPIISSSDLYRRDRAVESKESRLSPERQYQLVSEILGSYKG